MPDRAPTLTLAEAAARLGISPAALRQRLARRAALGLPLPGRHGREWAIAEGDLAALAPRKKRSKKMLDDGLGMPIGSPAETRAENMKVKIDSARVLALMLAAGKTQRELDDAARLHPGWAGALMRRIEAGQAVLPRSASRLARALGCKPEEIIQEGGS